MRLMRRDRGNAIAETGPALLILILFTIFPAITILGMGAQYGFAWYHNHLVVEELAQRRASEGGAAGPPAAGNSLIVEPAQFRASQVGQMLANGFDRQGLAKFIGVQQIDDRIAYFAADPANAATTNHIEVKTTLSGKPFISLPMFGFTRMNYGIAGEAMREVLQ
jgi:hypothetical protein